MGYLKITCYNCEGTFELYQHTMNHEEKPPRCPHCLARMTDRQWERLVNAYFTFEEVDKNFRTSHEERGTKLFQAEFKNYYVKPEKIIAES